MRRKSMARPTLVIGLGGTGQWVLTYLKKDLLESNNGEKPGAVRLLCFDYMPQAGASLDSAQGSRGGEKEVRVGSVQLENDREFIHLSGNVYQFSEAIRDAAKQRFNQEYEHLISWYQSAYWLETLPRGLFAL